MDLLNRAFIGIRPSAQTVTLIEQSLLTLKRKPGILDMRWNQPTEYLINLVPLGEVSPATLARVSPIVGQTIANLRAFDLEMSKFAGLPNMIQPRFAVLQLSDPGALENATKQLTPPRDSKPFHPSIVMGRIKTESEPLRVALGRALKTPEHPPFGVWHVHQLELLISTSSTMGVGYKVVESYNLIP
jgi:2'-5' RNA ligase